MSLLSRKRRRDIRRQRWQFIAVGATVAIGVMLFAATYDSYRNLTASYEETYRRLGFADMTISGGDDGLADTIAAIPGVATVETRHVADLPITVDGTTLRGRLIGMPVGGQPNVDAIDITDGSYLEASGASDVVAEIHVARTFDLVLGDTVTVAIGNEPPLTIVGIAASAEYIWPAESTQEIFPDPEQFGVFFADEELVAALPANVSVRQTLVLYDEDADVAATDALVTSAATTAGATNILTQADQPSNATLQLDVEGFGQMAVAFPLLFLTAAGMAVYVLLTRLVYSQRSIIGTLRASGMGARPIRRHYLGFGLILGSVGATLGVVLGMVAGALMTETYTGLLDIPDTVVAFRPLTFVIGIGFGVVAGWLAAVVPARAAYRIEPAEAMRGEAPLLSSGRSLIERVVPLLSRLPVRTRMSLRGIGRARRRSLSTVLGVMLALVLILAAGGMIDTIVKVINQQFEEISLEDAVVIAARPVDGAFVDEVAAVPGVASAEPVVTLAASVTRGGDTIATTLQGFEGDTRMHGWMTDDGTLPASGALLAASLADQLDLRVGDLLTIDLPTQDVTITLEVAGTVSEALGQPMYATIGTISHALASAGVADPAGLLAEPTVTTVMTLFAPDADTTTTISDLEGLEGVLAVQDARSLYNLVQQYLAFFYVFVGLMLAFGAVMAFALMFNTISVNVAERATEFATLKASGMSDRTIAWMIMGENLLLTLVGIVPGLLLGTWVASLMMQSYNNASFTFSLWISPLTYLVSATAMIAVALLSMIPGIRSVRRLDIGAVVRERAV